jgi:hypothetical protein
MRRGPAFRWAATLLVWALAPLAGLAVLNLPTLVVMQTHDASGAAPLGAIAAGLFVFAALWAAGALAAGRLHRGGARRAHLTVCGVLALAGLAYPYLYGLIGYLTYRDA